MFLFCFCDCSYKLLYIYSNIYINTGSRDCLISLLLCPRTRPRDWLANQVRATAQSDLHLKSINKAFSFFQPHPWTSSGITKMPEPSVKAPKKGSKKAATKTGKKRCTRWWSRSTPTPASPPRPWASWTASWATFLSASPARPPVWLHHHLQGDQDCRPPAAARGAGQARRVRGHQGRDQVHELQVKLVLNLHNRTTALIRATHHLWDAFLFYSVRHCSSQAHRAVLTFLHR